MKTLLRNLSVVLVLFTASLVYGAVSPVKVTVFKSTGGVAFTGVTDPNGCFATGPLAAGNYIVQFNSKNPTVTDNAYALVVSSGNMKVSANAVAGAAFHGGGVAMRVKVGAGLNVTGQIVPENGEAKIMVWVPTMPGSNMGGHWAEKGSADEIFSRTRGIIHRYSLVKMQEHTDVGLTGH